LKPWLSAEALGVETLSIIPFTGLARDERLGDVDTLRGS